VEQGNAPQVQYISGHWMDLNNLDDLQRAAEFAHGHRS
jgi:phosphoenolpyruvate phosphomutase